MKKIFAFVCLTSLVFLKSYSLSGANIDISSNLFGEECPCRDSVKVSDYPFPTEGSFIDFCDHKIDSSTTYFDPDAVELGDTIFVTTSAFREFVENIHPQIRNQYILVSDDIYQTHITSEIKTILYDPKVASWFTTNLILSNHPKIVTIPCGQCVYKSHVNDEYRQSYLKLSAKTTLLNKLEFPLIYVDYSPDASSDNELQSILSDTKFFFLEGIVKNELFSKAKAYWEQLSKFKFALAHNRSGQDSCNFWEAVGLNTIPVTEHSPYDELYKGTPSILVKNWSDLNERFLNIKYEEICSKVAEGTLSNDKAFFGYWANKIKQVKYALKLKTQDANRSDLQLTKFHYLIPISIKEIVLDSSINRDSCGLFVYGKCLGLRSFQLANCMPEFQRVLIADEFAFGNHEHTNILKSYTNDEALFANNHSERRSEDFIAESQFFSAMGSFISVRMFMDLTHYRFKFTDKLLEFYQMVPAGSIICGNMASDQYVQDLLLDFTDQQAVMIQSQGDIWFLTKK